MVTSVCTMTSADESQVKGIVILAKWISNRKLDSFTILLPL